MIRRDLPIPLRLSLHASKSVALLKTSKIQQFRDDEDKDDDDDIANKLVHALLRRITIYDSLVYS